MLCQRPEHSHNAVALASTHILGSIGDVSAQVPSADIESRFRINATDVSCLYPNSPTGTKRRMTRISPHPSAISCLSNRSRRRVDKSGWHFTIRHNVPNSTCCFPACPDRYIPTMALGRFSKPPTTLLMGFSLPACIRRDRSSSARRRS
jgi:hypothetical protein